MHSSNSPPPDLLTKLVIHQYRSILNERARHSSSGRTTNCPEATNRKGEFNSNSSIPEDPLSISNLSGSKKSTDSGSDISDGDVPPLPPHTRSNGVKEWTVLSGVVIWRRLRQGGRFSSPSSLSVTELGGGVLEAVAEGGDWKDVARRWKAECVSIGTGQKSLPHSSLLSYQSSGCGGQVLHDCHAEVVARRGFVRWLMREAEKAKENVKVKSKKDGLDTTTRGEADNENDGENVEFLVGSSSDWLEPILNPAVAIEGSSLSTTDGESYSRSRGKVKWKLKDGVGIGIYVSMLPCGDASTYWLSKLQTPSLSPANPDISSANLIPSVSYPKTKGKETRKNWGWETLGSPLVRGRIGFENKGVLRTKPGRLDSPPSLSHSCSDKISSWLAYGIQGSLIMREWLVEPIVPHMIVLGGWKEGTFSFARDGDDENRDERVKQLRKELESEVKRSLWERANKNIQLINGRHLNQKPPIIHLTDLEFEHSRPRVIHSYSPSVSSTCATSLSPNSISSPPLIVDPFQHSQDRVAPAANSLSWICELGEETITSGIRHGASIKKREKDGKLPMRARSRLCKFEMFSYFDHLVRGRFENSSKPSKPLTYYEAKHPYFSDDSLSNYQRAKETFRSGPFKEWIVHGRDLESFLL